MHASKSRFPMFPQRFDNEGTTSKHNEIELQTSSTVMSSDLALKRECISTQQSRIPRYPGSTVTIVTGVCDEGEVRAENVGGDR